MTSSRIEGETYFQLNNIFYNDHINKIIHPIIPRFERLMKSYALFKLFFLLFISVEIVLILAFFTFISHSAILAISLALFFLTLFSYFILNVYYQTKKPEQYIDLKNQFIDACKSLINYQEGCPEHHIALANACCKLADSLYGKEYSVYKAPSWLSFLNPILEKISCRSHWQDLHHFKELLLKTAVDENVKLVKCEPTSLEVHASLANAYVMLSALYVDSRRFEGFDEERWVHPDRFSPEMEEKFRAVAGRAIEEFKVLSDYAPNDPWVHAQLAYSYRDLHMPEEEIKEYETILKLNPGDRDTLYKLGVLYFQQGLNAQGLRIYEELKRSHYKKAERLIEYYGSFNLQ